MSDKCGYEKPDGEECELPACRDDGLCWHHTDEEESDTGRPTKFNDETREACIQAAKRGKSKAGCARSAGVGKATLERWLDEHGEFRNAFRRARGIGEDKLVRDGLYDPDVDSSMAKFLLASSFDYVKAEKREVTGEDGGAVDVVINESVVED